MFCDNCGVKLIRGSKFCESCGLPVVRSAPQKSRKNFTTKFFKNYKFPIVIILGGLLIFGFVLYLNDGEEIQLEQTQMQGAAINQKLDDTQQKLKEVEQSDLPNRNTQIEELQKEVAELKKQQQSFSATSVKKDSSKLSNSEIIAKVKPAVVYIYTETTEFIGRGSGMIIDTDGYILTNAHVVEGVNSAKITLSDKRTFTGYVVGRNDTIDLAIVKISGTNLRAVELGDSDESVLKQGDEVFALGYPFGLEGDVSFKEGTISRRYVYEGITYLETSAEIHPGNSGGPLVSRLGQVIGINTGIYGKSISGITIGETIKFAIPINFAKVFIPQLKTGQQVTTGYTAPSYSSSNPPAISYTNNQLCQNNYGVYSTWTGQYNSQGGPVCSCMSGYKFNSGQTACVAVPYTPPPPPPNNDKAIGENYYLTNHTCVGLSGNQYAYCLTYAYNH